MKPFDRKSFVILREEEVGGSYAPPGLNIGPYDMSGYGDVSLHLSAYSYTCGCDNLHLLVFAFPDMDDDFENVVLVEDVEVPLHQSRFTEVSLSVGIDPLPAIMGILLSRDHGFDGGVVCTLMMSAQCLSDSAIPLNPYTPPCW